MVACASSMCCVARRLTASVGQRTLNHKRRRPDAHHATRCPSPHRVPTDQPRPEEHGPSGHRSCPRTPSGLTAHGRCPGAWSVLKPIASARLIVSAPAHYQCPGAWSVPRPIVGTPAHGRCPGLSSVLTAHCRYSDLLSVLQPIVGTHSPWSVPTQKNRGQAPSITLYSAQQGGAGDALQRPLRSRFRARLTPGVRLKSPFPWYAKIE